MKILVAEFDFFCGSEWKRMNCKIKARNKVELTVKATEVLKHMARDNISRLEKLKQILDSAKEEVVEFPLVELAPA